MTVRLKELSGPGPSRTAPVPDDALWAGLARVEQRVRRAVADRRAVDPQPDDPYRGQYLTPEAAEDLLASPPDALAAAVDAAHLPPPPAATRLGRLAAGHALDALDTELLLVAMAPDLDARFEPLYGYLNDDLTRRRPTVGLALQLCGLHPAGPGRFRLAPAAPLVARGLVEITEAERPLLTRVLRVPDRVTAHLLGDDALDARLLGLVRQEPAAATEDGGATGTGAEPVTGAVTGAFTGAFTGQGADGHATDGTDSATGTDTGTDTDADAAVDAAAGPELTRRVADAVATGGGPVYLREKGGDAASVAVDALTATGRRALVVDLAGLLAAPDPARVRRALTTEAGLGASGIVLGPVDLLEPGRPERARLLHELCAAAAGVPLVLHGRTGWDPLWSRESPVPFVVGPAPVRVRAAQWQRALAEAAGALGAPGAAVRTPDAHTLSEVAASCRLGAAQVRRAADVAVRTAAVDGRPVSAHHVRAAVRAQNGAALELLARRIEPAVGWDDLVLPDTALRQLRELSLRARHREQVLGQWGMRPGGGRGRGVIALFAGESGTGKTMSAEVVAADLGLDLYVVDLSTVVDKYVGETEKNLERIFAEASEVNAVLLFDEADAIFGRRSQVKDAHDRHANIESAYLLQRMESFDGIAVLTTNLRSNLDEAFTRRLDVIAEFPLPGEQQRLALWNTCLGTRLPRDAALDLELCARRFELSGGSIRACAVTAAYLAAESGRPLGMAQIASAVLQEYRKLGRLVVEGEFEPWLPDVRGGAGRDG